MYSSFALAKKYAGWYLSASNGKGHGVHSPFVFSFIKNVLRDGRSYYCYGPVEALRQELLADNTVIEVEDFGAGSAVIKSSRRVVKAIARSSLKPRKFAQLLFRMVNHYQPEHIVELGTSLGITTAYLASGNDAATVYTCEGAAQIAAIAQHNLSRLGIANTRLVQGSFDNTFAPLLEQLPQVDFAFVDGNHRQEPTLQYFEQLLPKIHSASILVFDDIHWSPGMEAAWEAIRLHPAVTLSIDLFFIGIVFFDPAFLAKQHFSIRF